MRKYVKENIIKIFRTLYDAHKEIKKFIESHNYENVGIILGDCQDAAVQIGSVIEQSEGEGFITVKYLEEYCKALYEVSLDIGENCSGNKSQKLLDKKLIAAENSVKSDIEARTEAVWITYKAAMWDSLESTWLCGKKEDTWDTYVIAIPYYDRNPDGSLGQFHYEGSEYPDYVPIIHYETYDIEARKPDVIFICNGYDDCNFVTSVDPAFYSSELKKHTELLVYIPYYLLTKYNKPHLLTVPAAINADMIVAQSEQAKEANISELKKLNIPEKELKEKIIVLGSPKIDRIRNILRSGIRIQDEWIKAADNKTKMLINTNISLILGNSEHFIENMRRIFGILKKRGDVFVIWREHPLSAATLKSMRSGMLDEYEKLKADFISDGIGVIDTNSEAFAAVCFSDCYFGAGGSLVPTYAVTGKPMMLTDYHYPEKISPKKTTLLSLQKQSDKYLLFYERFSNSLDLFIDNLDILNGYADKRMAFLQKAAVNTDGTVGEKVIAAVKARLT